ncbi:MAG: succinoglycan biosynthesis protein ExoM [Planctomycetota bacterium]|jgi:succinoglycan biosynthesis protein ExoM
MKLTVCALTYRRPEGLKRLLEGFESLEKSPEWKSLDFVIVDNDPNESGRALCEEFQNDEALGTTLRYINQPIQGIARSRNVALDAAENGDWTAFIDDDERPEKDWLVSLYASAVQHEADVVGGPVAPIIEGDPPSWIKAHGFFERRKYADGTVLGHVFTNNVLFRSGLPKQLDVRFDERPEFAALRVGEDRLFFQSLALRGAKTVYCDHALVHEWIPAERANEKWLIGRMYKIGVATAAVEKTLTPGPRTQLVIVAKGITWSLLGLGRFILGGFLKAPIRTKARRWMAYGRGLLTG